MDSDSAAAPVSGATQPWGADSETALLRRVALARPPDTIAEVEDPAASLFRSRPRLDRLREQSAALESFYRSQGIAVSVLDAPRAPPNIIFMRDLFLMTPEGAVLARPAYLQRRPEVPLVREFLAQEGVPLVGEVSGSGTFEGADSLWLSPRLLMIGVGNRTNAEGATQLTRLMSAMGIQTRIVAAPPASQHLLGSMNFMDGAAVAVRPGLDGCARSELEAGGYELIQFADDEDVLDRRCLNFVALGPGRIVAPRMSAPAREKLRRACSVRLLDVGEYLNCDGGIACATGILSRQAAAAPAARNARALQ